MTHYVDIPVGSAWTKIDPVSTPTSIQNTGNADIRVSKGTSAPPSMNYGNILYPGMTLSLVANQTIWVCTEVGGSSRLSRSDVE